MLERSQTSGLALHMYVDTSKKFPYASNFADSMAKCGDFTAVGVPHHSGNFALLPYLEQKTLFDQVIINQSLDSGAANRDLLRGRFLSVFTCPSNALKRTGRATCRSSKDPIFSKESLASVLPRVVRVRQS